MRTLAIETSIRPGSLALFEEGQLLAEASLPDQERTTSALTPSIQGLLKKVGWRPTDVQLVATTVGPGSFTGLRVAVTTAKTLAYAVGAEIVGLNTLEVIALQAAGQGGEAMQVDAIIDAGRGDLFAARYILLSDDTVEVVCETHIVPAAQWIESLPSPATVTGPALEKEKLTSRLPSPIRIIDASLWQPSATTVGRLAWQAHRSGRHDDLWQLVPQYYRKSAAEEKWEQRSKG